MSYLKNIWLLAITLIVTSSAYAHSDYDICYQCSGSGETWDVCAHCGGSGEYSYFTWVDCGDCSGTGEIFGEDCAYCGGSGGTMEEIWVSCSNCDGMGISITVCPICGGTGVIETESFNLLAFYCAEIHQKPIQLAA
jgi:DnaJ-class molecular chaperone